MKIYGKGSKFQNISQYTQLLHNNDVLDLKTVFLLDKDQKAQTIFKEVYSVLKKLGLVEGRYLNFFVSYKVANMVVIPMDYVKK